MLDNMEENKYSVIVNRKNKYNENYFKDFNYIKINNVNDELISIEEETFSEFENLKNKMKENNIIIGIKYALRNENEQQELYKEFCEKYGKEYADKIVCPVGTSEHHTGLAIDIEIYLNEEWVSNNANLDITRPILEKTHPYLSKYGFILRYPRGKENITNVTYEPWHIRYVGKKLADYLYKNNLTLEEYFSE